MGFFSPFFLQIPPCSPQAELLRTLQLFASAPGSSSQRCPVPWALPEDPPGCFSILPGATGGCGHAAPKASGYGGRGGQSGRQCGVATYAHTCPCVTGLPPLRKVLPVSFLLFMRAPPAASHPCPGGGWKWDEAQGLSHVCPTAVLGQGGGREDGRWGRGLCWGHLTPLCLRTEPAEDGSVPLLAPNLRIQS